MIEIQIPLRGNRQRPQQQITRGQLYNLDDNEYFQFQFNPIVEPRADINWTDQNWLSTARGHTQFLGIGPFEFELALRFEVAPGAPRVPHSCSPSLVDNGGLVLIENVLELIDRWCSVREDLGRPSLVAYIMGDTSYRGRITSLGHGGEDRFPSGRLRRLTIRLGFRQWRANGTLR